MDDRKNDVAGKKSPANSPIQNSPRTRKVNINATIYFHNFIHRLVDSVVLGWIVFSFFLVVGVGH